MPSLYDYLRRNSLRALGYADGGDVGDDDRPDPSQFHVVDPTDRADLANTIHVVDQSGRRIQLPKPPAPQPRGQPPRFQDPVAGILGRGAEQLQKTFLPSAPSQADLPPAPDVPQQPAGLKDIGLGIQSGLASTLALPFKASEALYGGRTAMGRPLSQAVESEAAPDPAELAARQGTWNQRLQKLGELAGSAPAFAALTAATGGTGLLPEILAGSTMGAMEQAGEGADPVEGLRGAIRGGAETALIGGAGHALAPAAGRAWEALPSAEDLAAAQQAARQRLTQRGVFSGAQATMGADPETLKDIAILTGSQLGLGAHQLRNYFRGQQQQTLAPETLDAIEAARASSPEFRAMSPYLTPMEAQKIVASQPNIDALARLSQALPSEAHMAALTKAGEPKRGWYRGSSQAIYDIFGDDAPRFAQLLAAMSPQTSVEMNLQNTLNTWKNWTAAGRPTDPAAIKAIMGQSVAGTGTEESVLGAWLNNSVRALSAEDPRSVTLSGPKVDSFYHNLINDVHRVTNDAWMANAFGVNQNLFAGSATPEQLARGDPGLSPGYITTSARVRQGAARAGMLPAEGQETIWSVAMPLYETARKLGISPQEVLDRGLLTPQLIRGTPDFSTLFRDPQYARILGEAGYGPQLQGMRPFEFPVQSTNLTPAEQRYLDKTAGTLGQLAELRGREKASRVIPVEGERPERAFAYEQSELVPGRATGMLPGLVAEPFGTRKNFTSRGATPWQDLQGRDILQTGSGLGTLPARTMTGAYQPETGPVEINPGYSLPTEVPLTRGPQPTVPIGVQRKLSGIAAIRGALTGQEGATWNAPIPDPQGPSLRLPLAKKATPEAMAQAVKQRPDLVFADTGTGVNVLNFGATLPDAERERLEQIFNSAKAVKTRNVSDYIDYAKDWAQQPGSGAVTRKMFDYVNQMTPADQARIDRLVRGPAGAMEQFYAKAAASRGEPMREDLMNLLRTVRDRGLVGAREALQSGAFLPGLVGAVLLPSILERSSLARRSTQP